MIAVFFITALFLFGASLADESSQERKDREDECDGKASNRENYKHSALHLKDSHPFNHTIVTLFEWTHKDIAEECPFLAAQGYGAVQISPPAEHTRKIVNVNTDSWDNTEKLDMPWYIKYQVVSYKLESRAGTEEEFKQMVETCNKVGVRILVDVILNHTSSSDKGKNVSWSGKTDFDGIELNYNDPTMMYTKSDFNYFRCHTSSGEIEDFDNRNQSCNCNLVGLNDLYLNEKVRKTVLKHYLNKMIGYGVAGFRFDASRHIWAYDLQLVVDGLAPLREDIFGKDAHPFIVHEITGGAYGNHKITEYTKRGLGRWMDFIYGERIEKLYHNRGGKSAAHLLDYHEGSHSFREGYFQPFASHDVLMFLTNHDTQRYFRKGGVLTHENNAPAYKLAMAGMLASTYGVPRIMSSYFFRYAAQGPPTVGKNPPKGVEAWSVSSPQRDLKGGPCKLEKSDVFTTFDDGKLGYGWVCEHRWWSVAHMVKWRQEVGTAAIAAMYQHEMNKTVGFARLGKGYFAMNTSGGPQQLGNVNTTLPAGKYCNVFTDEEKIMKGSKCTAGTVEVKADGLATIDVPPYSVVAINLESRIGGPPAPKAAENTDHMTRTVIAIKKDAGVGNHIFIRGAKGGKKIRIVHHEKVPKPYGYEWLVYEHYEHWRQGNDWLSWDNSPGTQGTHDGVMASGVPMKFTTMVEYSDGRNYARVPGSKDFQKTANYDIMIKNYAFNALNHKHKLGENVWMVDLLVDCKKDESFEIKGMIHVLGNDPHQASWEKIRGGGPFTNHMPVKCGYLNVFEFDGEREGNIIPL